MSDEITEAEVRTTRDVAQRMHATNAERGTEYRMDPGLAAAALTLALDALDAERARVAEWTAEARERDAEVSRWQSEARDLGRGLDAERKAHEETRQGADLYRVDRDYHCARAIEAIRERDEARKALASAEEGADAVLRYEDRVRLERERDAAEAALADVRQRCGGYPDSRVDGDGGIVAVVVRERDEARGTVAALHERAASVLRGEADAIAALPVARLPVIATCGQCHDCDPPSYDTKPDERKAYCVHPAASAPPDNPATRVDRNASPPEWCPLRRETP